MGTSLDYFVTYVYFKHLENKRQTNQYHQVFKQVLCVFQISSYLKEEVSFKQYT